MAAIERRVFLVFHAHRAELLLLRLPLLAAQLGLDVMQHVGHRRLVALQLCERHVGQVGGDLDGPVVRALSARGHRRRRHVGAAGLVLGFVRLRGARALRDGEGVVAAMKAHVAFAQRLLHHVSGAVVQHGAQALVDGAHGAKRRLDGREHELSVLVVSAARRAYIDPFERREQALLLLGVAVLEEQGHDLDHIHGALLAPEEGEHLDEGPQPRGVRGASEHEQPVAARHDQRQRRDALLNMDHLRLVDAGAVKPDGRPLALDFVKVARPLAHPQPLEHIVVVLRVAHKGVHPPKLGAPPRRAQLAQVRRRIPPSLRLNLESAAREVPLGELQHSLWLDGSAQRAQRGREGVMLALEALLLARGREAGQEHERGSGGDEARHVGVHQAADGIQQVGRQQEASDDQQPRAADQEAARRPHAEQ
eukprot:4539741-Prymnesium_polylepis.2